MTIKKKPTKNRFAFLCALALFPLNAVSQSPAPERLMTDLLEHTECVFQNGFISTRSLEQAVGDAQCQVPLIHSAQPRFSWQVGGMGNDASQANSQTDSQRVLQTASQANSQANSQTASQANSQTDSQRVLQRASQANSQMDLQRASQTAYQIQVATSEELLLQDKPDVWDSQRVESAVNTGIVFGAASSALSLLPNTCYYWRVRIWDGNGEASPYSTPKKFLTAATFSDTLPRYPLVKDVDLPGQITRREDGYFIDFGKATFGQLALTLSSESDNDTVSLHLGEAQDNGAVHHNPGGTIRHCSYHIALHRGTHTYQLQLRPDARNTSPTANESSVRPILLPSYIGEVYPFRYCQLTGYNKPLLPEHIVRQSVHYPFDDSSAYFHCSDSVLNQVWSLCKHSIKATTFCGVYVDGDRERIPYEADALINQLAHYATDREFSLARYSVDYLMQWPTWPTEWIMQSVMMLWNDYLYTGDSLLLARHYEMLHARTLSDLCDSTGLISTKNGRQDAAFLRRIGFRGKAIRDIVDWPQSGALGIGKEEAGEADGYDLCAYNTVVNAYHYRTLCLMSQIAQVLGDKARSEQYTRQAAAFRKIFNRQLFDPGKGCYRDGLGSAHHSLHANMFPLAFGLVEARHKESVCSYIQSRGMACSVYGAQFLLDALFDAGMDDYALSLLCSTGLRSWYNMIRLGSTVTLEAWDARFKPNLDWNHAWGAAPANLIPRHVVGVQPLDPAFRTIRIKPHAGHLTSVEAAVPTIQGTVLVAYQHRPQEAFSLQVSIPANSQAQIWMPRYGRAKTLIVDGKPQRATIEDNCLVVMLGPGKHIVESGNPPKP